MRKLKLLSLFFVAVLVLVFVSMAIGGERNVKFANDRAYDFPIKPGTDAWKKFVGHDEMLAATQIPADVLKNMSTRALVETCLNYPMYGDMMVYDDRQKGLEAVISGFDGLQELLKREDAGIELLAQYRLVNKEIAQDINDIDSKKASSTHYFEQAFIEMLLAQSSVRASMSEDEEKILVKECLSNLRLKQNRPDIYNFLDSEPTILIMKRVLERRGVGLQINGKQVIVGDNEADLSNNADQIIVQSENFISK
ncbi:MAG: hypothetical protein PHO56_02875 [Patescibacteria group bacterium]|nr:hypothetical protein [Patescibacteria group bacterium]